MWREKKTEKFENYAQRKKERKKERKQDSFKTCGTSSLLFKGLGWVQSHFGATAKLTYRQTDRTGGEWVQSPFGVKQTNANRVE